MKKVSDFVGIVIIVLASCFIILSVITFLIVGALIGWWKF